jgi:glycosyltransferase involved in cell wall biosynthesis
MNQSKLSILVPTYNGAEYIGETLRSILSQSFSDFEIIASDDASTDETEKVIKSFSDPRIKFFRNEKNLGYPGNLNEALKRAGGEIIYLMGQDDILGKGALHQTWESFQISEDIGAVTRPYFWFDEDILKPVRAKNQTSSKKNEIIKMSDDPEKIITLFHTLDQLSGLAYRKKFMDLPFHEDIFPCHVYPFASILKKHPVVFLGGYNVAVRIRSSQSRKISSIYDKSPIQSWAEMFQNIFPEKELSKFIAQMIENFVARNYVGLVQIRNYAQYRYLLREIGLLLKYRPQNIFSPSFWFFSLGCALMPPFLLIPLVDWYKNQINSTRLSSIQFDYVL